MIIREYHEEIEYDLLTRCGVDLLDFYRGTLSPRRVGVLLRGLPPDSSFRRAAAPDDSQIASWGPTDYLLADLFDITAAAHFKDPKPYPRPVDQIAARERAERRRAALEAQAERVKQRRGEVEGVTGDG